MTTFEITITTLLALIAFALIFSDFIIGKAVRETGVLRSHIDRQINNNYKPKNSKYIWKII